MRYNDVIHLISEEIVTDEYATQHVKLNKRMVFANKYQVSLSEFYSSSLTDRAKQETIRNKTSFQIRSSSYNEEQKFLYKDIVYDIVRVSDNGEFSVIVGAETIGKY